MKIKGFNEKEKRRQIIVVANEKELYNMVKYNKVKCQLYNSAFDLVENHFEELEGSEILVDENLKAPEELKYTYVNGNNAIDILRQLLEKYEFESEE